MLPIAMDGSVDQRQWTLQHRKAADITLTPPQADMDTDCLDVNVKGPGEWKNIIKKEWINVLNIVLTRYITFQMVSPH